MAGFSLGDLTLLKGKGKKPKKGPPKPMVAPKAKKG